ncbi:hypothetical protein ARMSODRAFT_983364 [Armillaria solidipes]|uniref:Uncharacterized protein n=1 Tax=Armillaria solidipes TaxID=1076256 RepID=A0A2H3AMS8_9AGAR|nr:hypothetical protein ARMSODRAFT_983364 [Armillaria solidipes]
MNVVIYDTDKPIKIGQLKLDLDLSNSYAGLHFRIDLISGDNEKTRLEYLGRDPARMHPSVALKSSRLCSYATSKSSVEMPKENSQSHRFGYLVNHPDIEIVIQIRLASTTALSFLPRILWADQGLCRPTMRKHDRVVGRIVRSDLHFASHRWPDAIVRDRIVDNTR